MRILMLFLDGVGIGKNDPRTNALLAAPMPALRSLLGGALPTLRRRRITTSRALCMPLDATLGMRGLPQSGTGQAALFTGVNASRVVGRHFGPYPYSTLRPIIKGKNIFRQLLDAGHSVCFANAFPKRFFDYMKVHPSRLSMTTLSCTLSGVPLLQGPELEAGRAISADITNEGWKNLGHPDIQVISPEEAGRRLSGLSRVYDFVLFEYWKTDYAGHARSMEEAVQVLERFDRMLGGILDSLDSSHTLLLLTSDHGNIEELSTKSHTRYPVPLVLYGHRHGEAAALLQKKSRPSLTHVTPVILNLLASSRHSR